MGNNSAVYDKWMDEFEVYRQESMAKNDGTEESVSLKDFFETKIYPK